MYDIETRYDTNSLNNVPIKIEYEIEDGIVFISLVYFMFDDEWLLVPQKWRNENLEIMRKEVQDNLNNINDSEDY